MSLPICCNIVSFMPRYRSLICQIEWIKPTVITKFIRKLTLEQAQCRTLNCVKFNLSIQMFLSGLNSSKLYSTKDKLQQLGPRQYFRQWCNESMRCNCWNWKQMYSPKGKRSISRETALFPSPPCKQEIKERPFVRYLPSFKSPSFLQIVCLRCFHMSSSQPVFYIVHPLISLQRPTSSDCPWS